MDCDLISKLTKFADDTKMGSRVDSKEHAIDIQNDLDKMVEWADRWQMKFNAAKCKVMHVGTSNTNSSYTLGHHKLETTDTERDLGIIISNNLKTTKQWIEVEKKCNRLLGT